MRRKDDPGCASFTTTLKPHQLRNLDQGLHLPPYQQLSANVLLPTHAPYPNAPTETGKEQPLALFTCEFTGVSSHRVTRIIFENTCRLEDFWEQVLPSRCVRSFEWGRCWGIVLTLLHLTEGSRACRVSEGEVHISISGAHGSGLIISSSLPPAEMSSQRTLVPNRSNIDQPSPQAPSSAVETTLTFTVFILCRPSHRTAYSFEYTPRSLRGMLDRWPSHHNERYFSSSPRRASERIMLWMVESPRPASA